MPPAVPRSFPAFLARCRTHDPGHDGPRPIPDWPFVRELASALQVHDRLVVLKSRQMMASWVSCAWLLHRALTGGPGVHLVLSKEERSAKELIARIRFLAQHYRDGDLLQGLRLSRSEVDLRERNVRILSLPAAPYAVRGLSPRTVIWDEMAFTREDEEIWTSVKPAVDSGGRFVGISTPNGPSGVFARLATADPPPFPVHRLHYTAHPERTGRWRGSARAGLSVSRWRREQELSFEGGEGRVYDQFDPAVHLWPRRWRPRLSPGARYYRGVDFGYRSPAVVWVEERRDGSLIVFDALVGDRWPVGTLVERIRQVDAAHGLTERDYAWTAVDPAGAAVNDSGISPAAAMQQAGMRLVWRRSHVAPGVEAVRSLLVDARGRVSLQLLPRCETLADAFQGYNWDATGEVPEKDGVHDHLMDALRYLVINLPRFQPPRASPGPRVVGLPDPAGRR